MADAQGLPTSRHFHLEQLAGGVYAAVHRDGGAAIGNAGIVDLGDRTLIYDSFYTPQAAADLRLAAETLTQRPIDVVINSHWHNDHVWGNQVFSADTDIVSTIDTRQLIIDLMPQELEYSANTAAKSLAAARARLEAATSDLERHQALLWVDYYRGFIEAQDTLRTRLPNVTFAERLVFHGTERSAELIPYAGGHTPSDAVLYLPEDGIVFMSDLLFIDCHPFLGEGDPDRLMQIGKSVEELAIRAVVPGHGPVGKAADLASQTRYVQALIEMAQEMVDGGEPEEAVDELAIPEPYRHWRADRFFHANVHFLYKRRQGMA